MSLQRTLGVVVLVFYVDILLLRLLIRVLKPIVYGRTQWTRRWRHGGQGLLVCWQPTSLPWVQADLLPCHYPPSLLLLCFPGAASVRDQLEVIWECV